MLVKMELVRTRSQAESYIKLGMVLVNGQVANKPGFLVNSQAKIQLIAEEQFVSRGGLKLASVANQLKLDFKDKIILDVGSSTGGFTDFALKHGAKKVIAVDVGSHQLHPSLLDDPRIELFEKTDIRDFKIKQIFDLVLVDVSFISLRQVLPNILRLVSRDTLVSVMVKPQFEAQDNTMKHKGVIKNDHLRRGILKDFEVWVQQRTIILNKADSSVKGEKGNQERFYLLRKA